MVAFGFLKAFELFPAMERGMPISLDGIAAEWERTDAVRQHLRDNRRLFSSCGGGKNHDPACHVKEAAFNEKVLAPLVRRIHAYRNEDGTTQLFKIKQVEQQCPT